MSQSSEQLDQNKKLVNGAAQTSYKILNQKLDQWLKIKSGKLTKQQEEDIFRILLHAQSSHNIREYINMRYTNKLAHGLTKFELSVLAQNKIKEEIQRVKFAVLESVSDYSGLLKMQTEVLEKLQTFN